MRKQIPILVSTAMVQAILYEMKTQTRRTSGLEEINSCPDDWQFEWGIPFENNWCFTQKSSVNKITLADKSFTQVVCKCPYGVPGDILYVREEHYRYGKWVKDGTTKTGQQKWKFVVTSDSVLFEDDAPAMFWKSRQAHNKAGNWEEMQTWYKRLARFMPKSAARIWLEKEKGTVERVKSIKFADAQDEGVEQLGEEYKNYMWRDDPAYIEHKSPSFANPIDSFRTLWQSINGVDSWKANPWVWVVSFKILSTTGKPAGL